ncbi:tail fiber protein [uncultured Roseivirga sp.]|uniref:tail fiber protein n=1 Tax=uncultured Roseivirga sp. TaxID=543088 RepID=UPI000D797662|nr:tail fiber protein [uncultured Roseivirga sp.]PWL29727.1 MAG: hypothetical protein DCO95_07740 [Roseivirga sp. XM-24bin3]
MKKIFFSALISILLSSYTFAQGTQIGSSPIYYYGAKVGIGTVAPNTKLYVDNGISTFNRGNSPGQIAAFRGLNMEQASIGTKDSYFLSNVGIGTTSPGASLHVSSSSSNAAKIRLGRQNSLPDDFLEISTVGGGGRFTQTGGSIDFYTSTSVAASDNFAMRIAGDGKVGIGTTSPTTKLEVYQPIGGKSNFISVGAASYEAMRIGVDAEGARIQSHSNSKPVYFMLNGIERMRVTAEGKVGIGTTSPNEKLEVNGNALFQGNIESTKVKVTQSPGNWPDYVFSTNYQLTPLEEVEQFIQQNQHLPEVPSANEVETNGLDLGDMEATLLKKIEELTLYVIDQNKRLEKLEIENKDLKKEVAGLKKQD